jgi:AraC-like DNA-binding protein
VIPEQESFLALAELFDALEDAVAWVKDRDGRYCWVNRAFVINFEIDGRVSGNGAEQILGKTDFDFSPPFLAEQFRLDDEHVLAGNRIVNRIELVGEPDGQTVWNVTNKIPILNAAGMVVGTAGITRKLSDNLHANHGSYFGAVLAYIRDHFHTPITNQELARLAHMSVRAFERKFHAQFHVTPQKYLRKLQMRMASRALVYSDLALADVALSCGFADQSHFTRQFRRHFGRTPREYREQFAKPAAPGTKTAGRKQ